MMNDIQKARAVYKTASWSIITELMLTISASLILTIDNKLIGISGVLLAASLRNIIQHYCGYINLLEDNIKHLSNFQTLCLQGYIAAVSVGSLDPCKDGVDFAVSDVQSWRNEQKYAALVTRYSIPNWASVLGPIVETALFLFLLSL